MPKKANRKNRNTKKRGTKRAQGTESESISSLSMSPYGYNDKTEREIMREFDLATPPTPPHLPPHHYDADIESHDSDRNNESWMGELAQSMKDDHDDRKRLRSVSSMSSNQLQRTNDLLLQALKRHSQSKNKNHHKRTRKGGRRKKFRRIVSA
jgi:hypothetical protein